ncbi:hypothetical protein E2C01_001334 [Portunus trituberculatus]|uniref:Uncharacterized protein n=1 Tax=Portunus trituberculatus TaxID=210409 RepID=A0A5B7CK54_PORTR|nr:hypothetical protein [Portunus trituberculatus]
MTAGAAVHRHTLARAQVSSLKRLLSKILCYAPCPEPPKYRLSPARNPLGATHHIFACPFLFHGCSSSIWPKHLFTRTDSGHHDLGEAGVFREEHLPGRPEARGLTGRLTCCYQKWMHGVKRYIIYGRITYGKADPGWTLVEVQGTLRSCGGPGEGPHEAEAIWTR